MITKLRYIEYSFPGSLSQVKSQADLIWGWHRFKFVCIISQAQVSMLHDLQVTRGSWYEASSYFNHWLYELTSPGVHVTWSTWSERPSLNWFTTSTDHWSACSCWGCRIARRWRWVWWWRTADAPSAAGSAATQSHSPPVGWSAWARPGPGRGRRWLLVLQKVPSEGS